MQKLVHLICYLCGTLTLPLILHVNATPVMKWWVNRSHAVHPNICGQSSRCFSLGSGMPITSSCKQKINTPSFTEMELVMADDFMPLILWMNLFLEAQGYGACDTILLQDNKSAILLEKNSKKSSSSHTKHLNIRYFFITNRVEAGDLAVKYCPATKMVGNFFTKPLQGNLFHIFWKMIMNNL